MNTTFRLIPNKYRKLWIVVGSVALVLAILEAYAGVAFLPGMPVAFHLQICLWVFLMSLFNIAICAEKVEDERVKSIRSKAMMRGFVFTTVVVLGFSINISLFPVIAPEAFINTTLDKNDYSIGGILFMIFPAFSIVSYLFFFHFNLRNDSYMDYEDKMTQKEYFKKNTTYVIVRTLLSLLFLIVIIIVARKFK